MILLTIRDPTFNRNGIVTLEIRNRKSYLLATPPLPVIASDLTRTSILLQPTNSTT